MRNLKEQVRVVGERLLLNPTIITWNLLFQKKKIHSQLLSFKEKAVLNRDSLKFLLMYVHEYLIKIFAF